MIIKSIDAQSTKGVGLPTEMNLDNIEAAGDIIHFVDRNIGIRQACDLALFGNCDRFLRRGGFTQRRLIF